MKRSVSPSLRLESNERLIWNGVALTRQDALVEARTDLTVEREGVIYLVRFNNMQARWKIEWEEFET